MKLFFFVFNTICADSVHSPETLQARGDVLVQDQQPCFLPTGGPEHAAFPGQGQSFSSHHIWSAFSHLSPWHCRKYDILSLPPSMLLELSFHVRFCSCRWTLHCLLSECDQWPVVRVWWPVRDRSPWDSCAERRSICVVLQVSISKPHHINWHHLLCASLQLCFWWMGAGRAVRSRCGSGRKSWPWPTWRSPACCSFTFPENGWTSSTRSLNLAPSPTTHFFVSMEVHIWGTRHVNTHSPIQRL